ncbi:MAG: hypothetical protein SGILL_007201 [Bacillariaceae sp.]
MAPSSSSNEEALAKLHHLLWIAEWEVYQDPYRGILALTNEEEDMDAAPDDEEVMEVADPTLPKSRIFPWDLCQWGILADSRLKEQLSNVMQGEELVKRRKQSDGSLIIDTQSAEAMVQILTESSCPSLIAWTKQRMDERAQQTKKRKGKKRARFENTSPAPLVCLGNRPSDPNFCCPCDFNPFCLASMGGAVMNDILKERAQSVCIEILDEDDNGDDDKRSDSSDQPSKTSHSQPESAAATLNDKSPPPKKAKARIQTTPDGNERIDSHFTRIPRKKRGGVATVEATIVNGAVEESDLPIAECKIVNSPTTAPEVVDLVSEKPAAFRQKEPGVWTPNSNKMDILAGESDVFKFPEDDTSDCKMMPSKKKSEPTVTCQPLGSKRTETAAGEPGDVYTADLDEQPNLDDMQFSSGTKEELDGRRKSKKMEQSRIRRFVQDVVKRSSGDDSTVNVDDYMIAIEQWHKSLLFESPLGDRKETEEGKITIALPPGIENLGATCYLNTQFQCLAQNPVFLERVFSWRAVDSSHKLNGFMTKLQRLLAQMVVGGNASISTLEFSNELKLDHTTQQDPNEFGRLLFDAMEEAFKQCSSHNASEANGNSGNTSPDLKDLLKRIFHGETTFETTCMKCSNVTRRSEGFMDLNLPIVGRAAEDDDAGDSDQPKRKKVKRGTLEVAFDKFADSDVQFCFDQYMKAESLVGDNQYFCEKCNAKQDAERAPKLTELPPVLNVQLSRYVFDRQTFEKVKLTKKVLLPTILKVDSAENPPQTKTYFLCGVVRHQGTSANSGHYVAEVMEWTTGLWYEFNDEIVKVLPDGPSCSYVPNFLSETDGGGESQDDQMLFHGSREAYEANITGSKDVYNMFYVEEDYLSEQAQRTVERRRTIAGSTQDVNGETKDSVLAEAVTERENKYSVLRE